MEGFLEQRIYEIHIKVAKKFKAHLNKKEKKIYISNLFSS